MKKLAALVVVILALLGGAAYFLHTDVTTEARYVTSEQCKDCHQSNYHSWKENTLHPYMFRPVKSPEDILGDFESGDPAVTFRKDEIEYVVGNKWEQVYVRMIDGEYYPFPAKWYVMQKRWVPYKVKDWKETPMSYKCNGCHTTGFDPQTLKFSEFGIGCEACHGPGSTHVHNKRAVMDDDCALCHGSEEERMAEKDIIRSVSPSVCGQCHNRGKNAGGEAVREGRFNFPVNIRPGDDVTAALKESTPANDKKGKFWWGTGLAKNRHQEFSDWNKSKHAQSLKLLLEHPETDGERGELKGECLHCHSTDYRHAAEGDKPTLESSKFGVTCVACHEPHGHDKERPGFGDGKTQCGGCHIDSMSQNSAEEGKRHYPCPTASVSCADCHMPRIVKTGGFFSLRSHAFRIVPPSASKETKMPNSCQNGGCHEDRDLNWAIEAFEAYYPEYEKQVQARK